LLRAYVWLVLVMQLIQNSAVTESVRPLQFVVTHKDYRGRGYATECLDYAKKIAEKKDCYKMMLLTGSKKESTIKFYEHAGYNSSDKTAFIQWIE
jgi:GNAT superfamily N-acetyltransferase